MSNSNSLFYDFVAPTQIVFGWGRRSEVGTLARKLGRRASVICGSRTLITSGVLDQLVESLRSAGVQTGCTETISREPEVEDVDRVTASVREGDVLPDDFVLAIGGGSAIDLGKAVAAMATNDNSPTVQDYLEGVGRGLRLTRPPLPVLAMPTTAGTGSEATKNAVISCYDPAFKKSLRDERMIPRIALVDPQLSVSVPPDVTAASGMDAITQLFESYISCRARPIPRAFAVEGLKLAVPAVAEAVAHGDSRPAREAMAQAALLSGLCLANSGLGMAHGVAAALGVHLRVPHGVACALMLPVALQVNRELCRDDLARLARLLVQANQAMPDDEAIDALLAMIDDLCNKVGVPRRLSEVGVTRDHIPAIAASSRGNSMDGNPRKLSDQHLIDILESAL